MSSDELTGWIAYDRMAYSDEAILLARLCALFANVHRGDRKKPFEPEDFLPRARRKRPSQRELEQKLKFWASAHQGKTYKAKP